MKKPCNKYAPKVNSRPLFIKQPKTVIAYKEFFYKSDILKENFQEALKKITLFFFGTSCHPYDTRMTFVCHVIRMSLVCTCMSSVCHLYVLVFISMSLVGTCMSSVCHSYVLVCHPYVIRL